MIVPRTCTVISVRDADQRQEESLLPLKDFRDTPAYVLLGDPGAGKSKAFEAECEALGQQACLVNARDFLTFKAQDHPEWRGKTLFIDGLDEVRARSADAHTPFDALRGRLDGLGKPCFRLSCREADWLGANDRVHLEIVSPAGKVTVLRLDPLTDSDIEELLAVRPHRIDAGAFIAEANKRGIGDLLRNPQSLDLLARAVADGNWPESRKDTFAKACTEMVREPNEGHQTADLSIGPPTPAQLLDAAGHLCFVHLIAGKAGYTLRGEPNDEYPALGHCEYAYPARLRLVLGRRMLFKGVGASDNRFTPVHRHIAEFLAARYVAQLIDDRTTPLPARRVIALMTGHDGTVVTELRGLCAWLAAHCQEARAELIKRDPIGVGLYGDVRGFSLDDKRNLLASLRREGAWLDPWADPRNDSQAASFRDRALGFSALATPDMETALREVLEESDRGRDHQVFVDFVLRVVEQGVSFPCLSDILLDIARDGTRWPRVNTSALRAFTRNCPDSLDKVKYLKGLLADIRTGNVSDSDTMLLGIVLTELYPDEVRPYEVWDYFSRQEDVEPIGRLWWLWEIIDKSLDEQVAELLDNLSERFSELRPVLERHRLRNLPLNLLDRGLQAHGDQLDTARLYDWLGVSEIEYGGSNGNSNDICSWLEQRPEVHKAVILEGLGRCPDSDEFRFQALEVFRRLHGASLPPDFGSWCLEQAVEEENTNPRVADYLFEKAFYWTGNDDPALEILRQHARDNQRWRALLDELLASRARIEKQDLEHSEWKRTYTEERQEEEEKWLARVRLNEVALRENRALPNLLFQLAEVYFGVDSTGNEPKSLEQTLRGDLSLTQAVLQGFRGAINRRDVPALEEILSVQGQGRMHYLAWPFLAGLLEVTKATPEDAARWDDDRVRKAVAFYCGYGTPLPGGKPEWYQCLLATRPEAVAEVQVQIAVSEFRRGSEHISHLWELAHDKEHAEVARHAALPLLRAFPTRCKLKQLRALDHLLWAAIGYSDQALLRRVIENKLARTSMNVAQHVHWLAAGAIVSPATYDGPLENYVKGRENRIRELAEFFGSQGRVRVDLEISLSERLIRLVGGHVEPEPLSVVGGWIRSEKAPSDFVNALIQRLAVSPHKAAGEALSLLIADPALAAWRVVLSHAQDTQRVIHRDADYRHPTIEQVCQTLKGGKPANPGDLAALVMDRLNELAARIRKGNTDDWRQYWEGLRGQSPAPKHEDDCRDALLSDLQQRLPQGVDAQPEGHYASDKRADIRVSYGGFQVPVEVKKNTHRELWRAMREQLMAKYVTAPETGGYGIFLVFWFGKQFTQTPDCGRRPADGEELQERLTMKLSANERRKISVCVIDVSRP